MAKARVSRKELKACRPDLPICSMAVVMAVSSLSSITKGKSYCRFRSLYHVCKISLKEDYFVSTKRKKGPGAA